MMKKQICRSKVLMEYEQEFLSILKENNITSYEYINKERIDNKMFVVYDIEVLTEDDYRIVINNSDKCKILPVYD